MKRALYVLSVLLLLAAVLGLVEAQFHCLRDWFGGRPLGQRALAMRVLGQYLAGHYPGQRALVLANPFSQRPGQAREVYAFEAAGLHGLRQGLGSAVALEAVVFPALKPGCLENPRAVYIDPGTTTPLSYLVADDALDQLAAQHPKAELVVSLIGLPLKIQASQLWQPNDTRKFALLLPDLRVVGNQAAIRQAFARHKLVAIIVSKPGAPPEDQPLGRDLKMEFDQRFLLVTPETLDQYLRVYPRLF